MHSEGAAGLCTAVDLVDAWKPLVGVSALRNTTIFVFHTSCFAPISDQIMRERHFSEHCYQSIDAKPNMRTAFTDI